MAFFGLIEYSLSPSNLLKVLLLFSISLLSSTGIYFTTRVIAHLPGYGNAALAFTLATPFVMGETVVFVWFHVYQLGSVGSLPSLLATAGYVATLLFTVWLSFYVVPKIRLGRFLAIWVVLLILSPAATSFTRVSSNPRLDGDRGPDHKIKHVILITVDTLRADALSCYDQQTRPTPHIDQLAGDGIVFTKASAPAPWTLPSLASMMTGLSPSVHMAIALDSRLSDNLTTLAEYMRDDGYYTAAIGHNIFITPVYNTLQGFREYEVFPNSMGKSVGAFVLEILFPVRSGMRASTSDLSEIAIHWLEANYDKEFFLWLHYLDPHVPYGPPEDFLPKGEPPARIGWQFSRVEEPRSGLFVPTLEEKAWIKWLYRGEVAYVDQNLGALVAALKRLDLYQESLIIFTSDHGEEFLEHGGFEHGHSLYDELLWVPLIIKLPASTSTERVTTPVGTQRVMATVLDLCGIHPQGNPVDGDSLAASWGAHPDAFEEEPIISEAPRYYDDRESVIFDGMKYVRSLLTNQDELYDLARDPEERISIAAQNPERVERARGILLEHQRVSRRQRKRFGTTGEDQIKLDKQTIERLKSLGYLK